MLIQVEIREAPASMLHWIPPCGAHADLMAVLARMAMQVLQLVMGILLLIVMVVTWPLRWLLRSLSASVTAMASHAMARPRSMLSRPG